MNQIKTTQVIHLAFCFAVFAFAIVAFLLNKDSMFFSLDFNNLNPMLLVAPLYGILSVVISHVVFNNLIEKIDKTSSPQAKTTQYQTAFLVKCAFLEAAALFNIVAFLQTHNTLTMIIAAICFVALWLSRPVQDKVFEILQIQETNTF